MLPLLLFCAIGIASTRGMMNATFKVAFEVSMEGTSPFLFSSVNANQFLSVSASFFGVEQDNVTIVFLTEEQVSGYVDLGFTVSANTFWGEKKIIKSNLELFQAQLNSMASMPRVIGIQKKSSSCTYGKYYTFVHSNAVCQFLCPYTHRYLNVTNQCQPTEGISPTNYEYETEFKNFMYMGYGTGVGISGVLYLVYAYRKHANKRDTTNGLLDMDDPDSPRKKRRKKKGKKGKKKGKKGAKLLQKRASFYYYNDTEADSGARKTKKVPVKNVALSVASTADNSPVKKPTAPPGNEGDHEPSIDGHITQQ